MEDRRTPEAAGPYSTLLEINNAIISNLTQDSLFHAISEALRKVVPFDRALLYVAENDVLRTIALEGRELSGHSHGAHKEVNPRGTAAGWAFEHRQPRLSRNLAIEPRLPGDEILFSGGVRSYLIVPLIARDQAIGAVLLASFEPDRYATEARRSRGCGPVWKRRAGTYRRRSRPSITSKRSRDRAPG